MYGLVLKENIPKVVTSAVFACVGTAGQRCTTLRRLIVHEDLYDEVALVHIAMFLFVHIILP